MRKLKGHIRKSFLLLTGVVIFLSFVNKAFFTHSHVLPDGRIVVHAHPYLKHHKSGGTKGGPVRSHHHTPGQYCLLGQNITYFLSPIQPALSPVQKAVTYYLYAGLSTWSSVIPSVYRIRPPPVTA